MFVVNTHFSDLRKEPTPPCSIYRQDPLQETQLLYGEKVHIKEKMGEWSYVEAIEQEVFKEGRWQGYMGWISSAHLTETKEPLVPNLTVVALWTYVYVDKGPSFMVSFGTKLTGLVERKTHWEILLTSGHSGRIKKNAVRISEKKIITRGELIRQGIQFLGQPYHWGGRTPYLPAFFPLLTSVDCSGLINLIYQACDVNVPRNACDQYLKSTKKPVAELEPGDLLFVTRGDDGHSKIYHVMMYVENDLFLESSYQANCVQLIESQKKFGCPKRDLREGTDYFSKKVCGGAFV